MWWDWSLYFKRIEEGKVPSIGVSCMLSGAMTVTAIIDYLLGKKQFPIVPKTIHIDLMQQKIIKIGLLKRFILKIYIRLEKVKQEI